MKDAHGSDVLHARTDGVLHRSEMSRGVHEQAHINTEKSFGVSLTKLSPNMISQRSTASVAVFHPRDWREVDVARGARLGHSRRGSPGSNSTGTSCRLAGFPLRDLRLVPPPLSSLIPPSSTSSGG